MRVQSFRNKLVAWWLLLLLGRIMAPEAAVLGLHAHQHTTEEPAARLTASPRGPRAVFSPKHTHCHAEQLYDVPALLGGSVAVPQPVSRPYYLDYQLLVAVCPAQHLLPGTALRGPPQA